MLNRLDKWHKTRTGLLAFGLLELVIAYGLVSLSMDRGNFWWYIFTLVFLVGALQNLFRFTGTFFNGKTRRSR